MQRLNLPLQLQQEPFPAFGVGGLASHEDQFRQEVGHRTEHGDVAESSSVELGIDWLPWQLPGLQSCCLVPQVCRRLIRKDHRLLLQYQRHQPLSKILPFQNSLTQVLSGGKVLPFAAGKGDTAAQIEPPQSVCCQVESKLHKDKAAAVSNDKVTFWRTRQHLCYNERKRFSLS